MKMLCKLSSLQILGIINLGIINRQVLQFRMAFRGRQ